MKSEKRSWMKSLFAYAEGEKKRMLLSVLLSVGSVVLGLVPFYCMYRLICLFADTANAGQTFNIDITSAIPAYRQVSFQSQLVVGSSGKKAFSMSHSFLAADGMSYAYGSTFGGGVANNVTTLSKTYIGQATSIKKINAGALNNSTNGFISGSWFDFWGR